MSENRSTVSYSPSFGYDLAARRINGEAVTLDLSNWRAAGIGGDMVRADVLKQFRRDTFGCGLRPECLHAELWHGGIDACGFLQRCFASPFASIRLTSSPTSFRAGQFLQGEAQDKDAVRSFVVCGKPLPGHEMVVRDECGQVLRDREIGHIFVKGPSLMSGYYHNAQATTRRLPPTASWLPATWATCWTARSSLPAAPRI